MKTAERAAARDALRELIHEKVRDGRQYQWWIDLEDHLGEILDAIEAAQRDGPKRPTELSPEERQKRAEGRDRGVLNDGGDGA